jgi:hypothetical protein
MIYGQKDEAVLLRLFGIRGSFSQLAKTLYLPMQRSSSGDGHALLTHIPKIMHYLSKY